MSEESEKSGDRAIPKWVPLDPLESNPFFDAGPARQISRAECLNLLRGGLVGVAEFNRRRDTGWSLADLSECDLRGAKCSWHLNGSLVHPNLREANLGGAALAGSNFRFAHFDGASMYEANFNDADLFGASFVSAALSGAKFRRAQLSNSNLLQADLEEADLSGANLSNASLQGASLENADLSNSYLFNIQLNQADLRSADLTRAMLAEADLSEADLEAADLTGATLRGASLQDANLIGAFGFRLDHNYVRGAKLYGGARDPWSVLRRTYTGSALLFLLLPLLAYFGLLIARAAFWAGVGQVEERALGALHSVAPRMPDKANAAAKAELVSEILAQLNERTDPKPVWVVILGLSDGVGVALLTGSLFLYNVLLYTLSRSVSAMRDAEERSGYTPEWFDQFAKLGFDDPYEYRAWCERMPRWAVDAFALAVCSSLGRRTRGHIRTWFSGYRWCSYTHRFVMRPLLWISIIAVATRVFGWLATEVRMPV